MFLASTDMVVSVAVGGRSVCVISTATELVGEIVPVEVLVQALSSINIASSKPVFFNLTCPKDGIKWSIL